MKLRQFRAIVKARTMEFVRDKETFWWNLLFPLVMVIGFAFIFGTGNSTLFKVGLIGEAKPDFSFTTNSQIEFISYLDNEKNKAEDLVKNHKIDMLINLNDMYFLVNKESKNGLFLRRLLLLELNKSNETTLNSVLNLPLAEHQVEGTRIRYVDWLVPGVIFMNLMFSCLFGVGYVLVRYRKNGVLKRLKATPVNPVVFITAHGVSRFFIVLATSFIVYGGTNFFLHFVMKGSYITLLSVVSLGILSMISLGLVFASRIRSEELAGGVLNLVTFPMIILSGVFYSLEGAPKALQTFSKALPLTQMISAARQIMLEGAGFAQVSGSLLYLGILSIVFLAIASFTFSWE